MTARRIAVALLWVVLACAGCTTTLLSPADERAIGRDQHPRILEEFGGAYDDPALQAYVARIGAALVAASGLNGTPFTFTVLDSPAVNAFALPGGYVYVTRGLLALAGSEAELAGVLGHEIGHVEARHAAQQHGRGVFVGLGVAIVGAVIGESGASNLLDPVGGLILSSYSREQEFEADSLGLRTMARAGYDPAGMASFLERLRDKTLLDAEVYGGANPDAVSLAATHPRTIDRVQEARAALGGGPVGGRVERDAYFLRLDGIVYGDSPAHGFVRGLRFVHPKLGFEFTVPPEFALSNGPSGVRARAPNGSLILFDTMIETTGMAMTEYLLRQWGAGLPLADLTRLTIDRADAATGSARLSARQGAFDFRLLAIRGDGARIHRFLFATPAAETARMTESLQRTSVSFRRLTAAEAARERPYRLRIRQARPGDTVARLAGRIAGEPRPEALLRILNGLPPGTEPSPGQALKIIGY